MKNKSLIFLMIAFSLLTGCSSGKYDGYADPNVDMSVREIVPANSADIYNTLNDAKSAVVGISVELDNGYAVGSGVAISAGGYILTNFHVVEGGSSITLYYADKTTGSASVLWADSGMDMAVLKSSREIPYLSTAILDEIVVGEDVYAIGTPLTLEFKHTVTKGIVSALDRTLETQSAYGSSYLQSLVQHDASINPGNSGGPLINSLGQVIGLNTLKASEGEGIAFAIPIEIGKIVVEKIAKDNSYKTPYLGIFAFDSDLARVYGETLEEKGVYVISTLGKAKEAGIIKGDIITKVDGEKIKDMLDFRACIFKKNIGETISVKFVRGSQEKTVNILLTERA